MVYGCATLAVFGVGGISCSCHSVLFVSLCFVLVTMFLFFVITSELQLARDLQSG